VRDQELSPASSSRLRSFGNLKVSDQLANVPKALLNISARMSHVLGEMSLDTGLGLASTEVLMKLLNLTPSFIYADARCISQDDGNAGWQRRRLRH